MTILVFHIAAQHVALDVNVSSSLTNGQILYYQYGFSSSGLTIRLTISSGYVICYASDLIQNPNDDQGYVWRVTSSGFIDTFLDPSSLNRPAGTTLYVALEGSASSSSFTLGVTSGDRRCKKNHSIIIISNTIKFSQDQMLTFQMIYCSLHHNQHS